MLTFQAKSLTHCETPEESLFTHLLLYGVKKILFGTVKAGEADTSYHEDILRVAAQFNVEEMVAQALAAKPTLGCNNRRVSNRLDLAKQHVAKAYGVEKKVLGRALEAARRANGVHERKNLLAGRRRKERKATKGDSMLGSSEGKVRVEIIVLDAEEAEEVHLSEEEAVLVLLRMSKGPQYAIGGL